MDYLMPSEGGVP